MLEEIQSNDQSNKDQTPSQGDSKTGPSDKQGSSQTNYGDDETTADDGSTMGGAGAGRKRQKKKHLDQK